MPQEVSREHQLLISRLTATTALAETDLEALARLPLRIVQFDPDADIVRQGDRPRQSALLVEGFACRYKLLGSGQRQILSFHIPGDLPDIQSLYLATMDHSLATLTPCRVAFIPHAPLYKVIAASAAVTGALWRETLVDAAVHREWLAGVGRRSAHERIAHLICEIHTKLRWAGMTHEGAFELPITQAELADALGLTSVHVNRVLQDLRRDGLIASKGRRMTIVDPQGLEAAGDFDPAYLHLTASV